MTARLDQARPIVVYGALAALLAAVFVPMSFFRLVDGDEGTYLLVSRLVAEGQVPYHDFYYPQMFLLPYVYGAWMKVFGMSWYGARLLSALLSVALGLLVHRQVARLTGSQTWGVLAVVVFSTSSLAFGWYPLIKTFALPTLCLFAAWAVLTSRWSRWRWVLCGLLLGLAVASRVYVVALAPAFLYEILRTNASGRARLLDAVRFATGFTIALLPTEFFLLLDPRTFYFNVVGSQLIRTDYSIVSWWDQKTAAIRLLFGLGAAEGIVTVQFVLLFLASAAAWISSARRPAPFPLSSMLGIILLLASLIPTPVYTQYFCMPLPFLVVDVAVFAARLLAQTTAAGLRPLLGTALAAYILVAPFDVHRFAISGNFVPGVFVRANAVNWRLDTIREVSRAIDQEIRPGRPVAMSFWPGYFVETTASILPGMENHFALMFSRRVSPAETVQFKLMSYPELVYHLQQRTVDVVVLGNWTEQRPWVTDQVLKSGYTLSRSIAATEIYTLRTTTSLR